MSCLTFSASSPTSWLLIMYILAIQVKIDIYPSMELDAPDKHIDAPSSLNTGPQSSI